VAYQPTTLLLDDAVLTDAGIAAAGGGLPRRIVATAADFVSIFSPTNYWRFDNVGTIPDERGVAGANLTSAYGPAIYQQMTCGKWNSPYSVRFQSDSFRTSGNTIVRPGRGAPCSFSFWHFSTSNPSQYGWFLSTYNGVGIAIGFAPLLSSDDIFCTITGTGDDTTHFSSPPPLNVWNHMVATYDGAGNWAFYLNGVSKSVKGTPTKTLSNVPAGTVLAMNGHPDGQQRFSNVYYDEVSYFTRVLSQADVTAIYGGSQLNPGSAVWTVPQATGVPKMVAIPGASGRTTTSHLSHAYLSIDGGATEAAIDPQTDLGTLAPTGDTKVKVTLEDSTVYIGGDAGEGPTLWVETPGAPPDVTAIASHDGYIDITLSTDIGTIAAPTSDAAPAVQVTGATEPAPGVLRLATDPAYGPPTPPDITAIASHDGYIDITLSADIGTVAAPTSDAVPAVQVTGATNPAPSVLRLATDPAYPDGVSIVSVVSAAGGITLVADRTILSVPSASYDPFPATKVTGVTQPTANSLLLATEPVPPNVLTIAAHLNSLEVTFDQPLGTGTVITTDPGSPIFVTGRGIFGGMLQVLYSKTVVPVDPLIDVGAAVTLPTPAVDSTNVTGIFQGAIIIRSAIIKALQELREDPTLIRDALASLPQDVLTSKRYGEKTLDECVRWFTSTNVPVKLGLTLTQLTSPCISVELSSSDEAESTLGDTDYNVIERDPWNPMQARTLGSVHSKESYSVIMMVQGEPEFLLFLDTLVRFGIFRHKEDLLDERGFSRLTWNVGPAGAMTDIPGRENFFARTLRLNGYARNVWPMPLKAGQSATFITNTHFGPRVAPVAQNLEGTATSTPQTPTEPGPQGADPFDPATWDDRDIISGKKSNPAGPLGVTDEPILDIPT